MRTGCGIGVLMFVAALAAACHPRVSAPGPRPEPPSPPPPSTAAPAPTAPVVVAPPPITAAPPPVTSPAPGALGVITCEALTAANLGAPPGALPEQDIVSAMEAASYTLSRCYGRSLLLPGASAFTKMVATFVIGGDGRVLAACPRITSGSATLDQCVLYHLTRVQFPPPTNAGRMVVHYPLTFRAE